MVDIQINSMTVDVEDYFQVSAFSEAIKLDRWVEYESRVEKNTHSILKLFADKNIHATFFILGWVAERFPGLVREICEAGHEIACHGYSHQLIYRQTPQEFREETLRSKSILEDLAQTEVKGYRAASFSINKDSRWALDILVESGFQYDSSIFPVKHDRYGMSNSPRFPHRLETPSGASLIEYPMTTVRMFGVNIPVSGGGYFRLYPYLLTKAALLKVNGQEQRPFMFYLHPWEIDPDQPRIHAKWFSRFRHYNNLSRCQSRLERLLSDFTFDTVLNNLKSLNLLH